MIHPVSIQAHEPQHVAEVLAEPMGGKCFPFGPLERRLYGASGDAHGTMIEVYPERAHSTSRTATIRSCLAKPARRRKIGRSMCYRRCRWSRSRLSGSAPPGIWRWRRSDLRRSMFLFS
jgi:hypothetical protein